MQTEELADAYRRPSDDRKDIAIEIKYVIIIQAKRMRKPNIKYS